MSILTVPLSELCDMDRDGLLPDDPSASPLPFVGVENVEAETGTLNFDNGSRIGSQKSAMFRFDERHVLYAKLRPYLNKVAIPDFAGKCSTELVPLLPRDGVDRSFLAYLLRRRATVDFVMSSVTGSRMPRTDMNALLSMPVPLPPLHEQRRIVGILNRASHIERLRARATDRLQQFIPALFLKMFGDPKTNPMKWQKREIGDVCIRTKQRDPRVESERQFRYIDISGIDNVGKKINEVRALLGEDAPSRARKEIQRDDILVSSVRPNLNAVAMVPEDLNGEIASTGLCVLRANQQLIIPNYLFSCLTSSYFVEAITSKVRGASYPAVSDRDIKEVEIILPPLERQLEFATLVNRAHRTIDKAQTAAGTAAALSASLMDRLLDG